MRVAVVSSLVAALVGCGGDDSGYAGCDSISGGGAAVTSSVDSACTGCSVSGAAAAADGSFFTWATLTVNSPSGGVAVRATAQDGIVYPAGNKAAVFVRDPVDEGTGTSSVAHLLRTYLDGVLQESPVTETGFGPPPPGQSGFSLNYTTTKPFDAVEMYISHTQTGGTPEFRIYEICSDVN